jgi:hypothetical protein
MQYLPDSCIQQWNALEKENVRLPSSISTICPFCDRPAIFALGNFFSDPHRKTFSADAVCPGCKKKIKFWILSPPPNSYPSGQKVKQTPEAFYMYPSGKPARQEIEGIEKVDEQVARVYASTLKAYNAKIWDAAATCCRKALEGIIKTSLPCSKQNLNLYKAIEELPNHVDLKKPLTNLSHAIREGGNLGAHFDLLREPDEETAQMMPELLEYFLNYMYILPKKIEELDKKVSALPSIPPSTSSLAAP